MQLINQRLQEWRPYQADPDRPARLQACEEVGIESFGADLPDTATQASISAGVHRLLTSRPEQFVECI
jgi:hypothetical protein